MCINVGVIAKTVEMHLLTLLPCDFLTPNHSILGHPKVIPYTKSEHLGVIRFWVIMQTDRQTDDTESPIHDVDTIHSVDNE